MVPPANQRSLRQLRGPRRHARGRLLRPRFQRHDPGPGNGSLWPQYAGPHHHAAHGRQNATHIHLTRGTATRPWHNLGKSMTIDSRKTPRSRWARGPGETAANRGTAPSAPDGPRLDGGSSSTRPTRPASRCGTPRLIPLLECGSIRHVGVSNHNLAEIRLADRILGEAGFRVEAVQNHYSLLYRRSEHAAILEHWSPSPNMSKGLSEPAASSSPPTTSRNWNPWQTLPTWTPAAGGNRTCSERPVAATWRSAPRKNHTFEPRLLHKRIFGCREVSGEQRRLRPWGQRER